MPPAPGGLDKGKPALEMEAFDVEDVITASGSITPSTIDGPVIGPPHGAAAPIIDGIELN